jgi:hypothetical protein
MCGIIGKEVNVKMNRFDECRYESGSGPHAEKVFLYGYAGLLALVTLILGGSTAFWRFSSYYVVHSLRRLKSGKTN